MSISLSAMVSRLQEQKIEYTILKLQENASLLITKKGGRIFGPFFNQATEGLLWAHPNWNDYQPFATMHTQQYWNIGGERLWLAPELFYNVEDETRPLETYRVHPLVDPGSYALNTTKSKATLTMEIPKLFLNVKRTVAAAGNPLRTLPQYTALMEGLSYCGYSHEITLEALNKKAKPSETWVIMQVPQGGKAIVPQLKGNHIGWYYHPDPPTLLQEESTCLALEMKPLHRYKIGIHSAFFAGRAAYVNQLDANHQSLLIRAHFSEPSSDYLERPFLHLEQRGFSFHLYNSGDAKEQFSEIESQGRSIDPAKERFSSTDQMLSWCFTGEKKQLMPIASLLLHIEKDVLKNVWP